MSTRWTEEDLARFESNSGRPMAPEAKREIVKGVVDRQSSGTKFRNRPTYVGPWRFDSKLEAARYEQLLQLQAVGEVLYFLRQVPFALPGRVIYRADFMVALPHRDGLSFNTLERSVNLRYEDCKGFDTRLSKVKRAQVADLYGVYVAIVRKVKGKLVVSVS